ncbi:DUF2249 domain-containing protein [Candidatus Colwellia aromaticivorans]|uniref:DUF2249 domain-containing protein n=1 Tax=Candidatus Colwellia aromaticivorans TaxID=2267621 RepID=UPI000DF2FAF5|nr:DUF2249 domain-containing protein [Candidatus Colwellia aromaticivorans]
MYANLTFIKVDVSALAPPEPMTVILTHLARLTAQECLLIKHRRQPFPLYEKLNNAGFSYHCVVHAQDDITLYVFHQKAQTVFNEWLVTNGVTTSGLVKGKS